MSNKQAYEQKIKAQMDEWSAEIDKLRAKADKADAEAEIALNREIDDLRDRQKQAERKFDELQKASEDAWGDIKSGLEDVQDSFGRALRQAQSRFS